MVAELGADVDPFVLHLYAAVAEKERALIAGRTKRRSTLPRRAEWRLGNPIMAATIQFTADLQWLASKHLSYSEIIDASRPKGAVER